MARFPVSQCQPLQVVASVLQHNPPQGKLGVNRPTGHGALEELEGSCSQCRVRLGVKIQLGGCSG